MVSDPGAQIIWNVLNATYTTNQARGAGKQKRPNGPVDSTRKTKASVSPSAVAAERGRAVPKSTTAVTNRKTNAPVSGSGDLPAPALD